MARRIRITFEKHDVHAVAELIDDAAPLTAEAFWNALPLSGDAYHAKWANNEVYILTPPFAVRRIPERKTPPSSPSQATFSTCQCLQEAKSRPTCKRSAARRD